MLAATTVEWISAVGTAGGAVATTAAVIVALWQSGLQQRRRVHVTAGISVVGSNYGHAESVISVSVTNTGFRPLTLAAIDFLGRDGRNVFMRPHPLSTQLPVVLADGETANVLFPEKAVDEGEEGVDGFFAVGARDTLGNYYLTRYPGGPRRLLRLHRRRALRRGRREKKGPERLGKA